MPPRDILHSILKAGSYAPSGDNCQPWKFIVERDRVLVINLPEKDTSLYNFRNNAVFVAHGALIENIAIAAQHHGYEAMFEIFPSTHHENLVCVVTFKTAKSHNNELYPYIEKRCTNRKKYKAVPLSDDERESILATQNGQCEIKLVEDIEQKHVLADAVSLNERLVFETKALHQFLFAHIRWTEAEEKRERNGMYVETLELGSKRGAFSIFRHWSILKFLNYLTHGFIAKQVSRENAKTYFSSSAIGAILIQSSTANDYIAAGRLMQRVWLTVTKLGLSLQPMTGIGFLYQRILVNQTAPFTKNQISLITDAYKNISNTLNAHHKHIVMVFRIGDGGEPSARSSRLKPVIINA